MPERSDQYVLLLPERRRFAGQALSPRVGNWLARADRLADEGAGEQAQLQRYFHVSPAGWPLAAICRQAEFTDAEGACWLRADPVFLRADINGARLMAWGNLELSAADCAQFVEALQPAFADAAMTLSAGAGERWYLRLPADAVLPSFAAPSEALGEDVLAHLPAGDVGKVWRRLLNEAQIILHNHPLNVRRAGLGLPPINSLWFWGGGRAPAAVHCAAQRLIGGDPELYALARRAGMLAESAGPDAVLFDLRRERNWAALEQGPLQEALKALKGTRSGLLLDFADGARWRLAAGQGWRFWRRPLAGLPA